MLGNTRGIQRLGTLAGIVLKSIVVVVILMRIVSRKMYLSFNFKKAFQFFLFFSTFKKDSAKLRAKNYIYLAIYIYLATYLFSKILHQTLGSIHT